MNDQVKAEQPNEAHISPSELNAGLGLLVYKAQDIKTIDDVLAECEVKIKHLERMAARVQRYEVSFFNTDTNARMIYGCTDDHAIALEMSDCVEKHPTRQFCWVTDRQATVLPNM